MQKNSLKVCILIITFLLLLGFSSCGAKEEKYVTVGDEQILLKTRNIEDKITLELPADFVEMDADSKREKGYGENGIYYMDDENKVNIGIAFGSYDMEETQVIEYLSTFQYMLSQTGNSEVINYMAEEREEKAFAYIETKTIVDSENNVEVYNNIVFFIVDGKLSTVTVSMPYEMMETWRLASQDILASIDVK